MRIPRMQMLLQASTPDLPHPSPSSLIPTQTRTSLLQQLTHSPPPHPTPSFPFSTQIGTSHLLEVQQVLGLGPMHPAARRELQLN